jgi:hypothetical protein
VEDMIEDVKSNFEIINNLFELRKIF